MLGAESITAKRFNASVLKDIKEERKQFCDIFIFYTAGGEHEINKELVKIYPNSVHFVAPGVIHRFRIRGKADGYCIEFDENFFSENTENKDILYRLPIITYESQSKRFRFTDEQFIQVKQIGNFMTSEYETKKSGYEKILLSYLNILLLCCDRLMDKKKCHQENAYYSSLQLVANYKRLIRQHGEREHLVRFYAKELNCTPNYLNLVVKDVTGQRASDLIHAYLISEIKRLLIHTRLSHKEVAYALGFSDQSYMTKFFKKHTGSKPLEWFFIHNKVTQ